MRQTAGDKNASRVTPGQGRQVPVGLLSSSCINVTLCYAKKSPLAPAPSPPAPRTWERRRGQEPSLRLHHVPVAEEDEAAEVAGAVPLHVLHDVLPAQGAGVAVLHRPHPDVPSDGQEGHLQRGRGPVQRRKGYRNRPGPGNPAALTAAGRSGHVAGAAGCAVGSHRAAGDQCMGHQVPPLPCTRTLGYGERTPRDFLQRLRFGELGQEGDRRDRRR